MHPTPRYTPRNSVLFQFKHGDHICVFYRSVDKLMEILTPYIAEGLRKGERCFCVQKIEIMKRLLDDLRFIGINVEDSIASGALEFHSTESTYFRNGRFEPALMMDMLLRSISDSVARGFTGFRSAGDLGWASRSRNLCNHVIGYEKMVEESYPGKAATGLCQYPMEDFPADVLDAVLATHRSQLLEGAVPSTYASLVIAYGDCHAEIVADKFIPSPYYYYVVEKRQPNQVLGWGIAPDFEAANQLIAQLAEIGADSSASHIASFAPGQA